MYNLCIKKIAYFIFTLLIFIFALNIICFSDTSTVIDTTTTKNYGWVEEGDNWRYIDKDGDYATECFKKSNDNTYYLDEYGNMVVDYLYTDDDGNIYYFSDTGAMVRHLWVGFDPSRISEEKWDADKLYMYFQDNGKAYRSENGKKRNIEGKTYVFDEDGIMLTGWIDKYGTRLDNENTDEWYGINSKYYAREDGSLVSGWLEIKDTTKEDGNDVVNIKGDYIDEDTMYFYFSPKNFEKVEGKELTINGQKYRFE